MDHAFESNLGETDLENDTVRGKPGFLSSPPRIFMFSITTFMFALGLIALVLETALNFQQMKLFLDPTSGGIWSSTDTNIIIAVGATITRIMVRLVERSIAAYLC
jgi:hypothetical protein